MPAATSAARACRDGPCGWSATPRARRMAASPRRSSFWAWAATTSACRRPTPSTPGPGGAGRRGRGRPGRWPAALLRRRQRRHGQHRRDRPLAAIADFCAEQRLWFHADAAFGGLAVLVPELAPRLAGIEQADSLAFDFHKWLHVPYDAGCVLIRDERLHRAAFALRPDYLAAAERGLAGGNPWFTEYGVDLSRGFRALKVWFTLQTFGLDRLGEAIARNCARRARSASGSRPSPSWSCWRRSRSTSPASAIATAPGRARPAQRRDRGRAAGARHRRPLDHPDRRPARDPRLPVQPPHRASATSTRWSRACCSSGAALAPGEQVERDPGRHRDVEALHARVDLEPGEVIAALGHEPAQALALAAQHQHDPRRQVERLQRGSPAASRPTIQ